MTIKEFREKHLLSKTEFAKKLGVSQACVCYWENGRMRMKYEHLRKLRDVFKLSDDELQDIVNDFIKK